MSGDPRIADRDYSIDERMIAHADGMPVGCAHEDWALNDMLERADRGKMVELSIRVGWRDGDELFRL